MRTEIRFGGFGGQGIISAGTITGKAASIYSDLDAVLIQSYGPEARGGACSAEVVIKRSHIDYPQMTTPDIVILMSQEAYDKYNTDIQDEGTMILEKDLIDEANPPPTVNCHYIPSTKIAEELGNKIVANVVMLGFLAATSDVVSQQAMHQAIISSVPEGTEELNNKAFTEGVEQAKSSAAKGAA